jgi:hypothetical protein
LIHFYYSFPGREIEDPGIILGRRRAFGKIGLRFLLRFGFYREAVGEHSPGSRQRTLGRRLNKLFLARRGLTSLPFRLVLSIRFAVTKKGVPLLSQGALPRPWAVLSNRFAVKTI